MLNPTDTATHKAKLPVCLWRNNAGKAVMKLDSKRFFRKFLCMSSLFGFPKPVAQYRLVCFIDGHRVDCTKRNRIDFQVARKLNRGVLAVFYIRSQ